MATIKSVKEDKQAIAKVAAKLGGSGDSIGDKIDRLYELREKKRLIQKDIDAIEAEVGALKDLVIEQIHGQNLTGSRGRVASVGVNEKITAQVADWDKAHAFIKKNDYQHLYKKEILATGFRELLERMGEKKLLTQSGMTPFKRFDITLTKI